MSLSSGIWNPADFARAHGDNWRRWLGHLVDTPSRGLEIGTWEGDSADWALANIFTHPKSAFACVDSFEGGVEHRVAGVDCSGLYGRAVARLAKYGPRVRICRGLSHEVLLNDPPFPQETVDFAYIDASHDAMNVLRDSVLAFNFLKPGGVILWDDYGWNRMPEELDRPKLAIDTFLRCYSRQLKIVAVDYQVCCRKLSAVGA